MVTYSVVLEFSTARLLKPDNAYDLVVVELINLCLWFFLGSGLLQLGTPLQVFYVVFTSLVETKFFVDACIWDEFLDDHCCAQTLLLFYWSLVFVGLLLLGAPLMLWGAQSSTQN